MICNNCGAENKETAKFCKNCGKELAEVKVMPEAENRPSSAMERKPSYMLTTRAISRKNLGNIWNANGRFSILSPWTAPAVRWNAAADIWGYPPPARHMTGCNSWAA